MTSHVPRFYQDCDLGINQIVTLDEPTTHHLCRVLRKQAGDVIVLFNGSDYEYSAEIEIIKKNHVLAHIRNKVRKHSESSCDIHLAQAICRSEKMDWIIQKSIELGVKTITPVLTDFTNLKMSVAQQEKKHLHWQKVMISACEQSGRTALATIQPIVSFTKFIHQASAERSYIAHPGSEAGGLFNSNDSISSIIIAIGPEGGFSKAEINHADQKKYQPLSLGPRILRAETAAISAITLLQSRFGDLTP